MGTYKHFLLLVSGIVVLAGAVAWSLSVLPKDLEQAKLGASIGETLITADDESIAVDTESTDISVQAEPPKENAIPILLVPPQVKPGGKVQVTVGAPNADSVRSIEIFLESPDGLQVSRANIWNINGEGQWYDDISIREDAEPGTWKIKAIEITNTEGAIASYSYGKEIFQTFLVQASQ